MFHVLILGFVQFCFHSRGFIPPVDSWGVTGAFVNCQACQGTLMVQFGKRGSVDPAIRMGYLVMDGSAVSELLERAWHVPELAGSLFSVRDVVAQKMAMQVCPPVLPGLLDHVPDHHMWDRARNPGWSDWRAAISC
jgi:hypothetical protein